MGEEAEEAEVVLVEEGERVSDDRLRLRDMCVCDALGRKTWWVGMGLMKPGIMMSSTEGGMGAATDHDAASARLKPRPL